MRERPARSSYEVLLFPSAERDLSRLALRLRERVVARLIFLGQALRGPGREKLESTDRYRARVGDYRIVYEIDDIGQRVLVHRIAHRREVYRRPS